VVLVVLFLAHLLFLVELAAAEVAQQIQTVMLEPQIQVGAVAALTQQTTPILIMAALAVQAL
jgi:hypothetical protein